MTCSISIMVEVSEELNAL